MPGVPEDAIERAREALSLDRGVPARAEHVARLDRTGADYFLVWFGADNATIAVAAVAAVGGEVLSHARLPGSGPHLVISAERASALAGGSGTGIPRLAWRPCRASFSMLSPFWEVSTSQGLVYIDQHGHLWTELPTGGRGG